MKEMTKSAALAQRAFRNLRLAPKLRACLDPL
jgi:hypothetical protein